MTFKEFAEKYSLEIHEACDWDGEDEIVGPSGTIYECPVFDPRLGDESPPCFIEYKPPDGGLWRVWRDALNQSISAGMEIDYIGFTVEFFEVGPHYLVFTFDPNDEKQAQLAINLDRKSTRLNSSHRC